MTHPPMDTPFSQQMKLDCYRATTIDAVEAERLTAAQALYAWVSQLVFPVVPQQKKED